MRTFITISGAPAGLLAGIGIALTLHHHPLVGIPLIIIGGTAVITGQVLYMRRYLRRR